MNRKVLIGIVLISLAFSVIFFPVAHATTAESTYVPDTDMKIFNTFTVDVQPNIEAPVIYADSSLDNALLSAVDVPSPVPIEHIIETDATVIMHNPEIMTASIFNVTILNLDYSMGGYTGRVTSLRFEMSNEDHRMIAISALSEGDVAVYWLWYQDLTTNIQEVFGDWVRINGSHTLANGYLHLSRVMNWAANNIYAGSNNIYYSALERAYLKMADYSKLISHELTANAALFSFNKEVQNSLALLLDPTYYMSTNWWLRLMIKSAIYTAAVALFTHWYNPKIVALTTVALVAALVIIPSALQPDILGLAFATLAMILYIESGRLPWWLWWLCPILQTLAWAVENIGALITFGVMWKYKGYLLMMKPYLITLGTWLIIDFAVEKALDHFNFLRDY